LLKAAFLPPSKEVFASRCIALVVSVQAGGRIPVRLRLKILRKGAAAE
jgi:hypothetical protein